MLPFGSPANGRGERIFGPFGEGYRKSLLLRRMPSQRLFIDYASPPGGRRYEEVSVPNIWDAGEQLIFPGNVVDLDLHNSEIRNCTAKVSAHHRRQVATKIMGRNVYLERIGHAGDFVRLQH